MTSSALCRLGSDELKLLSGALRSGRLRPPLTSLSLRRFVSPQRADEIACEFEERLTSGYLPAQLADMLDSLAQDRAARGSSSEPFDLVWTGPEAGGIVSRDTGVVVRELFCTASTSVMIAGYAVYQGHVVFRALAERMEQLPDLRVRMYLDIRRNQGDSSSEAELVRKFAARFKEKDWPGGRLPELYFDPRSLDSDPRRRASMHAKCVVIDEEQSFVSSANFTEAAHVRNIEVGVLIRSSSFSRHLKGCTKSQIQAGSRRWSIK
jgi:PLD-like domain